MLVYTIENSIKRAKVMGMDNELVKSPNAEIFTT
ncbi:MAG: hypothetical protein K0S47_2841 [Herbinix sp.]|jgi:hypothetical protein|nr:hypothetical protein [Herbinix sp.]